MNYYYFLVLPLLAIPILTYLGTLSESQWIDATQQTHFIYMEVTKYNDTTYKLKWYGGMDSEFVRDIKVENKTSILAQGWKPKIGDVCFVNTPEQPSVSGYDLSVHSYRLISHG